MDLGIKGKRALVCASSKGLGRGCAEALAAEGVDLVMNARGAAALEDAAAAIRAAHGVEVVAVAADITTEEGRAKVLEAAGDIDILVTNAGGPPPGMWMDWDRDDFIAALESALGLEADTIMRPMQPGDVHATAADITAINRDYGFAPIMAIDEGLARFAHWLKAWRAGEAKSWR